MEPRSLRTLYAEHVGKVSDKWSLYLDVYDRVLAPYRDRAINLVEVGVQNGGSLEIWSRFFPNARAIVGCDIDPRCAVLRFDDPRIALVLGPINDRATAEAIFKHAPDFDVFLDDGSHRSADIVATFCKYFHRVRPGGLFLIEDLHCSYYDSHGGGVMRPSSAMGYLKLLADGINHDHWRDQASFAALAAPFLPAGAGVDAAVAAEILAITFYDSLCVIEKRAGDGSGRLGARVIVGDDAAVRPKVLEIRDALEADRLKASGGPEGAI